MPDDGDAAATEVVTLPTARGRAREEQLQRFADQLVRIGESIGFKVSARGWCYQLEQYRAINKDQFDLVEGVINDLRRRGLLPVDFVAEESSRDFQGVEVPEDLSPEEYLAALLRGALYAHESFTPDWWNDEEYYIQMVVEKVDLKTLFGPVCAEYHIPIATAKGWSSILQRAIYTRRFKEAEEKGLKCALLYCGDHDPDGVRISGFLRSNIEEISGVRWEDGTEGYDPSDLEVFRFGLNFDFIQANHLTWIDNLHTGAQYPCPVCKRPKRLDDPHHPNHNMEYVQEYIRTIGIRKCEANALVVRAPQARELCRGAIERFLGRDAKDRFASKREAVARKLRALDRKTGYRKAVQKVINEADTEGVGDE